MILAFIEEQLVGQLVFTGGARPRVKHAGEFGITVLKEHWGKRVGSELISYLIKWAKENPNQNPNQGQNSNGGVKQ